MTGERKSSVFQTWVVFVLLATCAHDVRADGLCEGLPPCDDVGVPLRDCGEALISTGPEIYVRKWGVEPNTVQDLPVQLCLLSPRVADLGTFKVEHDETGEWIPIGGECSATNREIVFGTVNSDRVFTTGDSLRSTLGPDCDQIAKIVSCKNPPPGGSRFLVYFRGVPGGNPEEGFPIEVCGHIKLGRQPGLTKPSKSECQYEAEIDATFATEVPQRCGLGLGVTPPAVPVCDESPAVACNQPPPPSCAPSPPATYANCNERRARAWGEFVSCVERVAGVYYGGNEATMQNDFACCRQAYFAHWDACGEGERFVPTDDGHTITDRLTMLVWEKKEASDGQRNATNANDADNTYFWSDPHGDHAKETGSLFTVFLAKTNSLDNGEGEPVGYARAAGWRIPALAELASTMGTSSNQPIGELFALDPSFTGKFMSSTGSLNNPEHAWDLLYGTENGTGLTLGGKPDAEKRARAVRGGL